MDEANEIVLWAAALLECVFGLGGGGSFIFDRDEVFEFLSFQTYIHTYMMKF